MIILYEIVVHVSGHSWFKLLPTIKCSFQKVSKKIYLYEVKAFKISHDAHLIFKGKISLGIFFTKMAGL